LAVNSLYHLSHFFIHTTKLETFFIVTLVKVSSE
jgi:hypothetical protein